MPLLRRAYELWEDLERDDPGVFRMTGGLFLGRPETEAVAGSLASAREHDLPHELLDAAEIRRRFPAFAPEDDEVGVFEERSGFVRPERTVLEHWRRARAAGAELRTGRALRGRPTRAVSASARRAARSRGTGSSWPRGVGARPCSRISACLSRSAGRRCSGSGRPTGGVRARDPAGVRLGAAGPQPLRLPLHRRGRRGEDRAAPSRAGDRPGPRGPRGVRAGRRGGRRPGAPVAAVAARDVPARHHLPLHDDAGPRLRHRPAPRARRTSRSPAGSPGTASSSCPSWGRSWPTWRSTGRPGTRSGCSTRPASTEESGRRLGRHRARDDQHGQHDETAKTAAPR